MKTVCCGAFLTALMMAGMAASVGQERAAPDWNPALLAQLKQLQQAALSDDYAYRQTAHLTDNIGPRPVGSPQAAAAVAYLAAELRRLGLEVRLDKISVPHWVRGDERAELIAYPDQVPGTSQKIVVTALGAQGVATTSDGITAEVVVVNDFDELRALPKEKVAGKIVLFNVKFDETMAAEGFGLEAYERIAAYRYSGRLEAARRGAAASLVRSTGAEGLRTVHTGGTGYDASLPSIPAGAVTAEDAELISRLSRQGPVRMHLVLTSQWLPDVDSYNVIGDLKGNEHPEQVVIVSGHLDSWDLGTGAIDDAAGVGVALQAVKLVRQLQLKPKRTIRFVAWMAEETGLQGAIAYARQHADELPNHFAAIESDLGAGHPVGVQFGGDEKIGPMLGPVAELLQSSGAGLLRPSDDAGSDITALSIYGVPTFAPIQDARTYFRWHHSAADTLDKIDPQELRENGAIMTVMTFALANMSGELPRKAKPIPEWMK
jgi:carboxypeptidase Q